MPSMTTDLEAIARDASLPYYEDALPAHDRFHAGRVRDLALRLADEHDRAVDTGVLAAAAWLHDIGRPRERVGDIDDHGHWAANSVERLLDGAATAEQVAAIEHCLRTHSIRPSSPEPETLEAQLLFDADKLEASGARGIVRLACIVGERSAQAGERYAILDDASGPDGGAPSCPDISLLREWTTERLAALHTEPGRRLGESRQQFMDAFFDRFDRERGVDGDA
jgi:uncharacterized protein